MDEEAKNERVPGKNSPKETSLGKRKISEDNPDNLDSVIVNEPRKKIQKVSHSSTTERESAEKMKTELILSELSFVQSKIACSCGQYHTITLSDNGTAYSFGNNHKGELGLGHNNRVSLPTPIPNLPKINLISCGSRFTVCVDYEDFIWSFGENNCGQLGTGNKTNFNVPQKIFGIPPVFSISCGFEHTLMITNDSNLWSWGNNEYGQLCFEDKKGRTIPQKTSFSNISKVSTGNYHSLFQNNKEEIFSCGYNQYGQCGLGHFYSPQITPILIPNVPLNIVQFVCGSQHSLFLDSEGIVFSVGHNEYGELGLGHNTNQNIAEKIPNIPPIKIISCVNSSCYLIDLEGNLWSFGNNDFGQLGHSDYYYKAQIYNKHIKVPKIINTLKNIQQISYGCCGNHFLAKNYQNKIFATGNNEYEQLETGDTQLFSIPKEINSKYSNIWRNEFYIRAKSARK